jgi:dihydropteroate synthase
MLGILNITPDSFSDGGEVSAPTHAAEVAAAMIRDGAEGVDIGGESTRPGAEPVSEREQIARVVPVIRAVRRAVGSKAVITVDTTRAKVAAAGLKAGADAINDVSAGTDDPGMFALVKRAKCGLILMHRARRPTDDRFSDRYSGDEPMRGGDVVLTIAEFLARRAVEAVGLGISADAIMIDPGLGFGKTVEQNLELIRRTGELATLGYPVMSALSRKSFVARAMMRNGDKGEPAGVKERLAGTISLSVAQMFGGARVFRVHDVKAVSEALRAAWAASAAGGEGRFGGL